MTTLLEKLPLPHRRRDVVDDCCRLLDLEVKKKKGISGLAVKAGFGVLKAIKPGAVREAIDGLIDDFIAALEPFHIDWLKIGSAGTFGATLRGRSAEVAEALVRVTDGRAENTKHASLKKMYRKLRSSAVRNVQEAVPALADLMDRYYES
ncbi:MAG TPA: hypothetical protein VM425_00030 [Myxococcota bacterium]|nr:hypothetical protein [Myxococcota bacterium]